MLFRFLFILISIVYIPLYAEKITVATMVVGDEYRSLVESGIENKAKYCEKHHYPFFLQTESLDSSRPIPWTKVLIILDLLENPEIDWVFWTDADSLVMNDEIRLESFLDSRYDFIVSSVDGKTRNMCTGQFFIRNCPWSKDFLKRSYARKEYIHHVWWEQMAMMAEFHDHKSDRKHAKLIDPRMINSSSPDYYTDKYQIYHKGDFILHFAGMRAQTLKDQMYKWSME